MAENVTAYQYDDVIDIENASAALPDGDYDFTVESVSYARYNGRASEKIPANCCVVDVLLRTAQGAVRTNFKLCSTFNWLIAAFFRSIGMRDENGKLRMDWKAAVGRSGRMRVRTREYIGSDGAAHTVSDVDKYYAPQTAARTPADGELPF